MMNDSKIPSSILKICFALTLVLTIDQASAQVVPYTSDANTILLDHFNGTTSATISAYNYNAAPSGTAYPSATPSYGFGPGVNGLTQGMKLNSPSGMPAGSGTYLNYPGGQLLSQTNGTIEFWVSVPSFSTGLNLVQQGQYFNAASGWTFGMSVDATGQLSASAWAAFSMNSGTTLLSLNTWTHVAATWGSSGARLYINGVLVGSDANTGMPASGYGGSILMLLGTHAGISSQVDELRVSNIQRTTFNAAAIPPAITSFTPTLGPVGTSVLISGTNFNSNSTNNVVYFGAVKATVTSGTVTGLTVNVPTGATYAPISVTDTTTHLTAYSSKPFTVMFSSSQLLNATSLSARVDFTSGTVPTATALADIDGDGKLDVLCANNGSNTISVWRNTATQGIISTSSLSTRVDLTSGGSATYVAVGDLDGDGKLDVVVANAGTNGTVSIFRNYASSGSISIGSFATRLDLVAENMPVWVAICDIDLDGKPDIIVENQLSNTISVYRNLSTGGSIAFQSPVDFASGTSSYGLVVGDIDGDGLPDIAVSNTSAGSISVLRNTSSVGIVNLSSFAAKVDFTAGTTPYGIDIGDIDGDGKLDLAVGNFGSSTVSIFRNTSVAGTINSGSFAAKVDLTSGSGCRGVCIRDIDGDGKPDILVANQSSNTLSVFKNISSSGSLTTNSFNPKVDFTTGTQPLYFAGGDLDGDGKPDIAVPNYGSNTVSVLRNTMASLPVTLLSPIGGEQWNEDSFGHSILWQRDTTKTVTRIQLLYSINNGQTYTVVVDSTKNNGTRGWQLPRTPSTTALVKIVAYNSSTVVGIDSSKAVFTIVDVKTYTHNTGTLAHTVRNDGYTGGLGTTDPSLQFPPAGNNHLYSGNLMLFAVKANGDTVASRMYGDDYLPVTDFTVLTGSNYIDTRSRYSDKLGLGIIVDQRTIAFTNESFVIHSYKLRNGSGSAYSNFHVAMLNDFDLNDALKNRAGYDAANQLAYMYDAQGVWTTYAGERLLTGTPEAFVRHRWTENLVSAGDFFRRFAVSKIDNTVADSAADYRVAETVGPLVIQAGDSVTITFAIAVGTGLSGLQTASQHAQNYWNQLLAAPTIISFSPTSGPIGTAVTIAGSNFNPIASNNIVYFGAVKATVTSATVTQLQVTVPTGATYQPITVTVNGLTTYSSKPFIVTFPSSRIIDATTFTSKVDFTAGTNPYNVAIGDINGDGKPDLAVVNFTSNTVSVFRNMSASGSITAFSFATKVDFTTGTGPMSVSIGDLDGDGRPDLVVTNNDNTVSVFRNTPTPYDSITASSFATRVDFTTGTTPHSISIGDIDGDGKPDLATANLNSNTVSVFRNTSSPGSLTTGSFAPKVDFAVGTAPRFVTLGDIDGDGKPDLAVTNASSNTVSVLRNTSTSGSITAGSFATKVDFTAGTSPWGITIGDIDGDGKPDLVVTNYNSNTASIFRNTSTSGSITSGSFSTKVDFTTGTGPFNVALGDVDGDGKPDIVIANDAGGTVSVLKNISTSGSITSSSLTTKVDFTTGTRSLGVAISDIDGDGKPDLAVANYGSNTVSVLRNTIGTGNTVPSAPTGLTATAFSSSQINLSWTGSTSGSPTLYRLFRSLTSGIGFTKIDSVNGSTTTYNNTGLTATTTYYYVVCAVNAGGQSAASNQTSATTPTATPPGIPNLTGPASGTSNMSTTVTFTWAAGSGALPTSYRLRVSINPSFSPLAIDDSTIASTQRTVSSLAYGTAYYWMVRAQNASGNSAYSSALTFATASNATHAPVTPISFPANPTLSTQYKMIAFPGNITGTTAVKLMGGTTPDDWIMFSDNGNATNYFNQLSASTPLFTGRGYWLIRRGNYSPSYSTVMPSLASDGTYSISLQPGWNIIGNPFNTSVKWSAVQAANGVSTIPIYSYSGTSSFPASTTMDPFIGYYFDNRTAGKVQLKIPYPFPASGAAPIPDVPFAWKVQLIFGSDINEDRENYIGVSPLAENNLDAIDTRKPPLFKDLGFLYFSRPDWDAEYEKFNGDFRRGLGEGQVWEFDVSNPRKSTGRIHLSGIESVPADYQMALINLDNTTPVDVRLNSDYTFDPVREKTRFRLIIGLSNFVQSEINKYIPTTITLYQNYPNPFNPSTTIGFALPQNAAVKLVVVNILGQEIKTLAEGFWGAGIHHVLWNGDDQKGYRVASGVYFCRLSFGNDVVRIKKMLLTK